MMCAATANWTLFTDMRYPLQYVMLRVTFGCRLSCKGVKRLPGGKPGHLSATRIGRECTAEHWLATLRLFARGLVLDHVPVLDQNAVLAANDVRRDPVDGKAEIRKAPVHD